MPAPSLRGRFVWHELMTTDPDAAARFYPDVTGWKVQTWDQDPAYRLWTVGDVPVGGLMAIPDHARRMGTPPSWLSYVGVPDVDATVRQATSLGGRAYVAPQDIPVGRFAVLADPQGAAFGVYKPSQQPARGKSAMMGDFSWHELATTDYKAAWAFYRALFGWEPTESMDMGPDGTYWMFALAGGDKSVGGMYNKPPALPAARWLAYVSVPSADIAARTAQRTGGRLVSGPMDVPGGDRVAQCVDPQGAVIAVHAVAAVAKPAARPAGKRKAPKARAKGAVKKAAPKRKAKRSKRAR